jgi:hypothetical protein
VYFEGGSVSSVSKPGHCYARAVRGGQSDPVDSLVIVAHTPSNDASEVARNTAITITFNRSMDRTSTEAAFSITPSVSGDITWTNADQTMTFTPSTNLSTPEEEYTVSIASFAEDTEGHQLDSNENGTGGEVEDTYTFSFTTEIPVLIELDQFTATPQDDPQDDPQDGHIDITWTTSSEIDHAGFNLWRCEKANGLYTKLNSGLIEAEGGPTLSAEYTYSDNTARPGAASYYYKLEDIDTRGVSTFHGPVSAVMPTASTATAPTTRPAIVPITDTATMLIPPYWWFEPYSNPLLNQSWPSQSWPSGLPVMSSPLLPDVLPWWSL